MQEKWKHGRKNISCSHQSFRWTGSCKDEQFQEDQALHGGIWNPQKCSLVGQSLMKWTAWVAQN